jgi:hypothetical protein
MGRCLGNGEGKDAGRGQARCIEFSWNGHDDCEAARGRGWAVLDADQIEGDFFIQRGDESAFKAKKLK